MFPWNETQESVLGNLGFFLGVCWTCLGLIKIIWWVLLPSEGSLRPDPLKTGGGEEEMEETKTNPHSDLCQTFSFARSMETWIYYQNLQILGRVAGCQEDLWPLRWQHTTASLWTCRRRWEGWGIVSWDKSQWSDYLFADRYALEMGLWEQTEMHCPLNASHLWVYYILCLLARCFVAASTTRELLQKPKLLMSRLFSPSGRSEVYLGDENAVTLTFNARNEGEGGAYEAELHVVMPSVADYIGIARNNEVRHTMCSRFNNLLIKAVLAVTEELVFISPQKQENTSGLVMHVVFASSPELHSADLQLWRWEPDPCVRSGEPHEVWDQCKNQKCPLWYGCL